MNSKTIKMATSFASITMNMYSFQTIAARIWCNLHLSA